MMRYSTERFRSWVMIAALALAGCGDDAAASEPNASATPDTGLPYEEDDASVSPCDGRTDTAEDFELGVEATGTAGLITGKLIAADPDPPEKYLNDWTIDFLNAEGEPIEDVEIMMARSWMPSHGHDGTFAPTITKLEGPSRYEVARLNLWMRGPWLIQLNVSSPSAGTDYIEFSICIED